MAIPEIPVDFAARNPITGRIPLSIVPSEDEITKHGLGDGDRVFLCDDVHGAVATIQQDGENLFGKLETEIFPLGDD